MMKPVAFAAVVALVVGGALVNGAVTQRWNVFEPKAELTDRLHALEVRFEDWAPAVVPTEMPLHERSTATSRKYASAAGRVAVVSFISGIPGSVSTHTPDVCYPGSGYRAVRGVRKEAFTLPDGRPSENYVADFEKKTQTKADRVRVRWAWTTDGTWTAPDRPRWEFAANLRTPVLYKVYVATPLPEAEGDGQPEDDAPTKAFAAAAWAQYTAAFAR